MQLFGDDIRFGVHSGPQHTSFDDYRDRWLRCEELGYDWVSDFDHFYPIHSDPAGPQLEGLTLLSAMAASMVVPSNMGPFGSLWIGRKWSKAETQS